MLLSLQSSKLFGKFSSPNSSSVSLKCLPSNSNFLWHQPQFRTFRAEYSRSQEFPTGESSLRNAPTRDQWRARQDRGRPFENAREDARRFSTRPSYAFGDRAKSEDAKLEDWYAVLQSCLISLVGLTSQIRPAKAMSPRRIRGQSGRGMVANLHSNMIARRAKISG
jgi:hypothetical protein